MLGGSQRWGGFNRTTAVWAYVCTWGRRRISSSQTVRIRCLLVVHCPSSSFAFAATDPSCPTSQCRFPVCETTWRRREGRGGLGQCAHGLVAVGSQRSLSLLSLQQRFSSRLGRVGTVKATCTYGSGVGAAEDRGVMYQAPAMKPA